MTRHVLDHVIPYEIACEITLDEVRKPHVCLKGIPVYDAATPMELLICLKGIRFSHHQMFLVGSCPVPSMQTGCYNRPAYNSR
jgi:hypothetical protein